MSGKNIEIREPLVLIGGQVTLQYPYIHTKSTILVYYSLKFLVYFLPNFAVFDIVEKINFSKNKSM